MLSFSDLHFTEQEEIDYIVSLDAMSTIGWDEQKGILLQVHPAEPCACGNYFKVYNAASERRATRLARINFTQPLYTVHAPKWNRGKDYWWLNAREKRYLMEFFESRNWAGYTNWQYAILEFNKEKGLTYEETKSNLLNEGKLNFPDALPYDLPIPNYMELPTDEKENQHLLEEVKIFNKFRKNNLQVKVISYDTAKRLGDDICIKYKKAFDLLKDK